MNYAIWLLLLLVTAAGMLLMHVPKPKNGMARWLTKRSSRRKQALFAEHGGQARVLAGVTAHATRMQRLARFSLQYVVRPAMLALLYLGAVLYVPAASAVTQMAQAQAVQGGAVMNTGYSPTGMNVANLPQAQLIHNDANFVDNLKANTPFVRCTARREQPEGTGNTLGLFMYQTLGGNTTQQADGVVGSSITVSVLNNKTQMGNFADYCNVSHFARTVSLDPVVESIGTEMSYRLGQTLSLLVRNTADGWGAIDSKASALSLAANVAFSRSTITTATQSLAGQNVKPFDQGEFCGVVHPFIVGDTVNDTANNSLTDILKRTVEGQGKLMELPAPDGDEVQVMHWGGVRFYQSTLVTATANYLASGKTALRTYIFGKDAVITVSLGKKEGAKIGSGDWRNLQTWVKKNDEPTPADPSRVIGGWSAYNVYFVPTTPPDTTMRGRYIDAVSNVA